MVMNSNKVVLPTVFVKVCCLKSSYSKYLGLFVQHDWANKMTYANRQAVPYKKHLTVGFDKKNNV
jgi:hypothetical protein